MFLHHPRHPATQCFPTGLGRCFGSQKEKYEENLNNLEHPPGSQTQQTRCCVESIWIYWMKSNLEPQFWSNVYNHHFPNFNGLTSSINGPRGFQIHLHDLEIRSKCLSLGSEMSGRGTQGTQGTQVAGRCLCARCNPFPSCWGKKP